MGVLSMARGRDARPSSERTGARHVPMPRAAAKAWLAGAFAAVGVLSVSLSASGDTVTFPECSREPTAADIEGAKGAHKAATQFFERADYDRAIQYWRDAYAFDCTKHALLLNIANAYEKKGDRLAAIATLETYIVRAPNAPDVKTISEKLINLKGAMKPATPVTPTATPSGNGAPPPVPTASAEPISAPPATSPGGQRSLVPWVVVGVGGAAAIAGAVLLPIGLSAISSAEASCPNRQCTSQAAIDEGNSGRTKATIGTGLLVGGVAIAAGGLVWQFAFNKPKAAPPATGSLTLTPVAGPGETGLLLSGSF